MKRQIMKFSRKTVALAFAALGSSAISLTSLGAPPHTGLQGQAFTYTSYGIGTEIEPGVWVSPGDVQLTVAASFRVLSAQTGHEVAHVTTDASGVFALSLHPGKYVLAADSLGGYYGCYTPPGPIEFTVGPKEFTRLNIFYFHLGPCILSVGTLP